MKNILITGSAGFVGENFLNNLGFLKKNQKIICTINENIPKIKLKNIIYIKTDILKKKNIYKVIKKYQINTVINFLGAAHNKFSNKNILKLNFLFVKDLCFVIKKLKVKKFIHISTAKINMNYNYRGIIKKYIAEEDYYNVDLKDTYTISKIKAENFIKNFFFKNNTTSVYILRPTLIYGPNAKANFKKIIFFVKYFNFFPIGKIFQGKKSFCSIFNLIKVIKLCLRENKIPIIKTFLVTDDKYYDIKQLIFIVGKYLFKKKMYFIPLNINIYKLIFLFTNKINVFHKIFSQMIISNKKVKIFFKIKHFDNLESTLKRIKNVK